MTEKYFGVTDAIFVFIAVVVAFMVALLGYTTLHEGLNTETTKVHGEQIAAWLEQHGADRAEGKAGSVPACDAADARWADCRAALIADSGPFAGMVNISTPQGTLFSPVCDHKKPTTNGAILIEKGTAKAAPNSGFDYAPLPDDEPLAEPLPLRVTICGRGFSLIRIKEVTF
jgi:hypothetical protein